MPSTTDQLVMRPITVEELPVLGRLVGSIFLNDHHEDEEAIEAPVYEPERSLAIFDGGAPVASAVAFTRTVTVPGGPVPAACVSWVAVAPTHRRRGLLTRMMRHQLTELHDQQREPIALLWASEASIYGRFGYGLAGQSCLVTVSTAAARMPADAGRGGRLRLLTADEAMPPMTAIYDSVRADRVGLLDRRGAWWQRRLFDPERWREGASSLRFAVHHDDDGSPDAYAIFNTKPSWGATGPNGEVGVREVQATTPAGYAAIWRFLLEIDLVRTVTWHLAAADEPLPYLLDNPDAVQQALRGALWVRIVDVDRALSARRYSTRIDTVLELSDKLCPWNSGRYRLTADAAAATCSRTGDPADLSLSVTTLGAAYLGGTTLGRLAGAGLVTEHRTGAVAAASTAFQAVRPPYSPEIF
ncbi:MAG: GNAT family N-acetyltransferase [Pseudonocardiales bacterium]|nr:MAG: GNAT family N-acetyltransferase [Pseudonocardiales bacterium]